MRALARRIASDERGAAALLTGLMTALVMGFAAFAVDVGYIYLQTRKLQGIADLAAMAAAGDIANAQRIAESTVAANGWPDPMTVSVVTGHYTPDPGLAESARFIPGGSPRNAARVTLISSANLFFGELLTGDDNVAIARSGVAATAELAAFSVGSRLLALDGGIANGVVSGLTGGRVTLSVMDYQGLARAEVDLVPFLSQLRIDLNLQGATIATLLNQSVSRSRVLQTLATMLAGQNEGSTARAVDLIAAATRGDMALGDFVDLGVYESHDTLSPAAKLKVGVMDLIGGVLTTGGDRDIALDLGANVPGIGGVEAWLAIGERPNDSPWLAVTASGEPVLHTAQMRLYVLAKVAPGAGLLGANGVATIQVPIVVEIASADAKLAAIDCSGPPEDHSVTIDVRPSVGHIAIAAIDKAKLNDFRTPLAESQATLIAAPLISVKGSARIDVGGQTWKRLRFSANDIATRRVRTTDTTDIASATLTSLLGKLELEVKILGLGLGLGASALRTAVTNALAGVAGPVDRLVNTLTGVLGLHLGQADVWVTGQRCRAAALVL